MSSDKTKATATATCFKPSHETPASARVSSLKTTKVALWNKSRVGQVSDSNWIKLGPLGSSWARPGKRQVDAFQAPRDQTQAIEVNLLWWTIQRANEWTKKKRCQFELQLSSCFVGACFAVFADLTKLNSARRIHKQNWDAPSLSLAPN